jgi:hypothetical protein
MFSKLATVVVEAKAGGNPDPLAGFKVDGNGV